jgi:hypothetical protein
MGIRSALLRLHSHPHMPMPQALRIRACLRLLALPWHCHAHCSSGRPRPHLYQLMSWSLVRMPGAAGLPLTVLPTIASLSTLTVSLPAQGSPRASITLRTSSSTGRSHSTRCGSLLAAAGRQSMMPVRCGAWCTGAGAGWVTVKGVGCVVGECICAVWCRKRGHCQLYRQGAGCCPATALVQHCSQQQSFAQRGTASIVYFSGAMDMPASCRIPLLPACQPHLMTCPDSCCWGLLTVNRPAAAAAAAAATAVADSSPCCRRFCPAAAAQVSVHQAASQHPPLGHRPPSPPPPLPPVHQEAGTASRTVSCALASWSA